MPLLDESTKKIIYYILGIIILILIFFFPYPRYAFKYYHYSEDASLELTRIDIVPFLGDKDTYFTPGHYKKRKVPDAYIKPYAKWNGAWSVYFQFKSNNVLFLEGAGHLQVWVSGAV